MIHQRGWRGAYILSIILFLLLPLETKAQTPITLDNLAISLWPEYDRPEVLVIYRVELGSDVSLPAQLIFKLPGYVDQMHAVAMGTEDGLITVGDNLVQTNHQGDDLILSFPTSSPKVQFEYYDSVILTKQERNRELTFDFSVPYNTTTVAFEVQQPFAAESFSLTPKPENTITGGDRLKYSTVVAENLAEGEVFQISATYQRSTDDLSLQALQQDMPQVAAQSAAVNAPAASPAEALGGVSPYIAYGLIGLGAVLLVTAGGYWWYNNNSNKEAVVQRRAPQKGRKPAHRKREKSRKKQQQATAGTTESTVAAFCYKCGAAFRSDANFCHACGAERRV